MAVLSGGAGEARLWAGRYKDRHTVNGSAPASQPAISLPPLQLLPLVLAALWEEPSRTGEDVEHLLPQASEGSGNGDWGTESRGPLYP